MSLENILSTAAWYNDLERKLNPTGIGDLVRIQEQLNRQINPMQQLADYARANSMPQAFDWAKSLSALSPSLLQTAEQLKRINNFIPSNGLAALSSRSFFEEKLRPYNFLADIETKLRPAMNLFSSIALPARGFMDWQGYLERSMGSISSLLAANIEDEENEDIIDRINEVSGQATTLVEEAVEQNVSLETLNKKMDEILSGINLLRSAAVQSKSEAILKVIDRVINYLSFIMGLVGLYMAMGSTARLEAKIDAQGQTISTQARTVENLSQIIYKAIPQKCWVTNRKCPVYFKPGKRMIVDSIVRQSYVDVIDSSKKWVQVSYHTQEDTFARVGWVDRGYLDTIRNFKPASYKSPFNL